jgi:hypothetical protein
MNYDQASGKYAPNEPDKVAELANMFRQSMQNVWLAFGENAARLYTTDEGEQLGEGRWEKRFSISALDIQAAALIGYSPGKVQAAAAHISEAFKFYLLTNPQVRDAILRRPAGKEATKTRWFGFKAIIQEIMSNAPALGGTSDPLFEAKALFRANFHIAAGAVAGVVLERQLKQLCINRGLSIQVDKATISNTNGALMGAGVYDQTQHKRVQVMGDIRNRCDHATTNPARKEEVWELIEDVGTFVRQFSIP